MEEVLLSFGRRPGIRREPDGGRLAPNSCAGARTGKGPACKTGEWWFESTSALFDSSDGRVAAAHLAGSQEPLEFDSLPPDSARERDGHRRSRTARRVRADEFLGRRIASRAARNRLRRRLPLRPSFSGEEPSLLPGLDQLSWGRRPAAQDTALSRRRSRVRIPSPSSRGVG